MDIFKIKSNFEEKYSLVLINSENNASNIGEVISCEGSDEVRDYHLSFSEVDKFEKFVDDFDFVILFSTSMDSAYKVSKTLNTRLYKVCDVTYSRKRSKKVLPDFQGRYRHDILRDDIEAKFSFRIAKEFDISSLNGGTEGDFFSILKQIRRDLKLDDLGI